MSKQLFVGLDTYDHGKDNSGEIFVATFSRDPKYSEVRSFGNHRATDKDIRGFERSGGDVSFTLRKHPAYNSDATSVPYMAVSLIEDWIRKNDISDRVNEFWIGVDGGLTGAERAVLEEDIRGLGIPNVSVKNYVKRNSKVVERKGHNKFKKGKARVGYVCPPLVWLADGFAHNLFLEYEERGEEHLVSHPKFRIPERLPGKGTIFTLGYRKDF